MRREYLAHGVQSDRVVAIPCSRAAGAVSSAPGPSIDVLFLGRLTRAEGRGCSGPCRLASTITGRSVTLTVAGDGPERERLDALAASTELSGEFSGLG